MESPMSFFAPNKEAHRLLKKIELFEESENLLLSAHQGYDN